VTATGNISVNQVAYGINTATATDTTGATMTQGIVDVVGGDSTSSITIKQSANVAEAVYVKAVAAKAATTTITFKALAATESVSLTGASNQTITFTAAKTLTAAEVAAAFANLAEDATFGAAPATNGSYTNGTSGSLGAGYTSGSVSVVDANNAAVVFTTSTWASSATQAITIAGTSGKASQVAVAGVEEVVGVTGRTGVVAGKVVVDGGKASEITVDGYETASTITSIPFSKARRALS
jgi:S-layer protein